MQLIWTDAGYAALVNPNNTGTNAVTVAKVALGTGTTPADAGDTDLQSEIKRIDSISGQAVSDNVIHVALRDETADTYAATEIGLIANDGTLLARYAQSNTIIEKASASTALLVIDATLTDVDAIQIQFGDISFVNPPWSESVQGVVQKATLAMAQAGDNLVRGMTPSLVFDAIKSYFGGATGAGAGKGLNADMLDGEHGAYYRSLSNATGNLPRARASGTYDIGISGSAARLGGKKPSHYNDANNLTGRAPRSVLPAATTQGAGAVERATNAEAAAGSDNTRYITSSQLKSVVSDMINAQREADWPIGSTYTNVSDDTNPGTFLPGVWQKIDEGFLYPHGAAGAGSAGSTGGEPEHELTIPEMPRHRLDYTVKTYDKSNIRYRGYAEKYAEFRNPEGDDETRQTSYIGSNVPHNNMPPYRTVYMWERTA